MTFIELIAMLQNDQYKKYLDKRQAIYREIATGYFQIGSLLKLDGMGQKSEEPGIALNSEIAIAKHIKKVIEKTTSYFLRDMDKNIKSEKDEYKSLLSLFSTFSFFGKIVCQAFDELSFLFLKPEGICK
jgi:hypothetical protein